MAGKNGKKLGRPSGCTDKVIEAIADHVREGLKYGDGAVLEGFDQSTAWRWFEGVPEFRKAVTRARILRKKDMVERVKQGIMASGKKGDWKAAMRLLESWEAEEYATTQQVELRVKNEHGDFLAVAREVLPDEQYAALLQAYVSRYGGGMVEDEAPETVH